MQDGCLVGSCRRGIVDVSGTFLLRPGLFLCWLRYICTVSDTLVTSFINFCHCVIEIVSLLTDYCTKRFFLFCGRILFLRDNDNRQFEQWYIYYIRDIINNIGQPSRQNREFFKPNKMTSAVKYELLIYLFFSWKCSKHNFASAVIIIPSNNYYVLRALWQLW